MNKSEIVSVLKDLYKISGFRVSLHGIHYEEIAAYPEKKLDFCKYIQEHGAMELEKCRACDSDACKKCLAKGETLIYKCRHGLVEAISPLYSFGSLTGFLLMGQIREDGTGIQKMLTALKNYGCDEEEAKGICLDIPTANSDMIRSFVNVTVMCARYLTLSNAIPGTKMTIGQLAMKYISENYARQISISDICSAIGYSKSTVLASFKREFGYTINNCITNMKLSHAKRLLDEGAMTINEIATATGFSNQSYFSKVFSAKYGITPSDYRKDESLEIYTHI